MKLKLFRVAKDQKKAARAAKKPPPPPPSKTKVTFTFFICDYYSTLILFLQKQPKKVQTKSVQQKAAPRVGGKRQLLSPINKKLH